MESLPPAQRRGRGLQGKELQAEASKALVGWAKSPRAQVQRGGHRGQRRPLGLVRWRESGLCAEGPLGGVFGGRELGQRPGVCGEILGALAGDWRGCPGSLCVTGAGGGLGARGNAVVWCRKITNGCNLE